MRGFPCQQVRVVLPCHLKPQRAIMERVPTVVMYVVLDYLSLVPVPFATKGRNIMANQNHLDQLRAGVDAWNHWRRDHPQVTPDLSGAELTGANLAGANLTAANLQDALQLHLGGARGCERQTSGLLNS